MTSLFLRALSPFIRFMPEVKSPQRELTLREKLMWTLGALIIYLIMAHLPLYGVNPESSGYDYLWAMRVILASSRGTLMELGIGPIVTAGLVMQLLSGSKIIDVDFSNPEDRAMFTGGQKVLAVLMTLFQAGAYIIGNAFGQLSVTNAILVFLQLTAAGIIVIMLDELVQKGWGLGSGVSLFIMANVAGQVFLNSFDPNPASGSTLPRGVITAILALARDAFSGQPVDWLQILYRPGNAPSIVGLVVTAFIFLSVIYLESVKVEIPLQYAQYRGIKARYPIKLMYTSNIPVILAQALYANIIFFTQILWQRTGGSNFWLNLLGNYKEGTSNRLIPQPDSLVYYITPPQGLESTLADPLHALIYAVILTLLCYWFSVIWVDISGMAPRDIARQLLDSGYIVPGFRRSEKVLEKLLNRYIPVVAGVGGLIIGLLAAFADVLGALSSGAGILLMVSIINQYAEQLAKEQLASAEPGLGGLLGII